MALLRYLYSLSTETVAATAASIASE
jgi:hypothetical protein